MKPRAKSDPKPEKRPSTASKLPADAGAPTPSARRKLAEIGAEIAQLRSALEKVARQRSSTRPPGRDRK